MEPVYTTSIEEQGSTHIQVLHQYSGYPGVKHTLYFVRHISPEVSKTAVQVVVRECEVPIHRPGASALENSRVGCA